ncbi:ATP-binding protein [candidate division CSSED10-310 bacterium]|uniref:ATP-binding protein n=1 Tax=candidate division CSSED10-310 bacterium TaxID=2855610 RepID=A0ABV6Z1T9_UNCC1
MDRPFHEIIPREKLLLYFYSIYAEQGIAVTLTTNEGIKIFDTEMMPEFCRERYLKDDPKCDECRTALHQHIQALVYQDYEKNKDDEEWCYQNCCAMYKCPYKLTNYGFPIWDIHACSVVAVLHAGAILLIADDEPPDTKSREMDPRYAIAAYRHPELTTRIKVAQNLASDLSFLYSGAAALGLLTNPFDVWHERSWSEVIETLNRFHDWSHLDRFYDSVLGSLAASVKADFATLWLVHQSDEQCFFVLRMVKELTGSKGPQASFDWNFEHPITLDEHSFVGHCKRAGTVNYCSDFTKIDHFKWPGLEERLPTRHIIGIPVISRNNICIGVINLYPGDGDFRFSDHIKSVFQKIGGEVASALNRVFRMRDEERLNQFRDKLPQLVRLSRSIFRTFCREILTSLFPELWIQLYYDSPQGLTPFFESETKAPPIPNIFEQKVQPFFLKASQQEKQSYRLEYIPLGPDSYFPFIMVSIHDYSKPNQPVEGILVCWQRKTSITHLASILSDRDRDFLRYAAFVFSLFEGLIERSEEAVWLSRQLGHEVIRPIEPLYQSFLGFELYYKSGKYELYEKRKKDLKQIFDFIIRYTRNLADVDSQRSQKKVMKKCNFFQRVVLPIRFYLTPYAAAEREINIVIEKGSQFPDEYLMDIDSMQQAFFNFVMNAVKYSFRRHDPRRIRKWEDVKLDSRKNIYDHRWEILIKNYGIGIPPVEKDLIFNKLYKCKNAWLHDSTGMGFGLTVAREAIEKHKGTVSVHKTGFAEGEMTELLVTLPLQ